MREIKFRGKRLDNGEWVYGYFYEECENTYIIEDRQHLRNNICARNIPFAVIQATVGQFTGLYDKDGKEIYEGDIVKFSVLDDTVFENNWKEYICEVSFCNGCFCTYGTPLIKGKWKGYDMVNVEIIGNIHDNPELLKGGAE